MGPRHDCPDPNGKLPSAFATVIPAFAHRFTTEYLDGFSLVAEGADRAIRPTLTLQKLPYGLFRDEEVPRHAVQSSILAQQRFAARF